MTNNISSNRIFGASERELLTLSLAEIFDGLVTDYKSFSRGNEEGIRIPNNMFEPRMSNSSILYAEGLRLAHTHLQLAKKLILASLYNFTVLTNELVELHSKLEKEAMEAGEKPVDIIDMIAGFPHHSTRAFAWLKENGEMDKLKELLKFINDFEAAKKAKRNAA